MEKLLTAEEGFEEGTLLRLELGMDDDWLEGLDDGWESCFTVNKKSQEWEFVENTIENESESSAVRTDIRMDQLTSEVGAVEGRDDGFEE